MFHYAQPPILLDGLIDDLGEVEALFERNAPYTPLGGWFRPRSDGDGEEAQSFMWFQKDWVHADFMAEGSELFLHNERMFAAAREFYGAAEIVPHTIYVNLMAAIADCGPAHTDNPVFRGRNRTNTPMMLLRTMLWSGLFEQWAITQATSIWWMNDVEGGGFRYWPHGPESAPKSHVGGMCNTAMVGDNHGMFHQVEPVGPFDGGTRMVGASAELAPAKDGTTDWVVTEKDGRQSYRAPFSGFRASVLWKADVYPNAQERKRLESDTLSLPQVEEIFNRDLESRGIEFRFSTDDLEDPAQAASLGSYYPEATPLGAGRSVFEALAG